MSAPLTVEDRRVWRQVERRMVGKYKGWSWVRAVLTVGDIRDAVGYGQTEQAAIDDLLEQLND